MWFCTNCGTEFDEPKYEYEVVGEYHGSPARELLMTCPLCKATDITEDYGYCTECGEPCTGELCENCTRGWAKAIAAFAGSVDGLDTLEDMIADHRTLIQLYIADNTPE